MILPEPMTTYGDDDRHVAIGQGASGICVCGEYTTDMRFHLPDVWTLPCASCGGQGGFGTPIKTCPSCGGDGFRLWTR